MVKKIVFFLLLFILSQSISYGQKPETVLTAPADWRTEIITFPMGFAPSIDFKGFEDIRFAPGWAKPDREDFWTYTFLWYIEKTEPMTEAKLTSLLTTYYNGLMEVVSQQETDTSYADKMDKTLSLFLKTEEGFIGKVNTFDAFFTKDFITLNIKVRESFCTATNKQMVFFDISPKPFEDPLWKSFEKIKLIKQCP